MPRHEKIEYLPEEFPQFYEELNQRIVFETIHFCDEFLDPENIEQSNSSRGIPPKQLPEDYEKIITTFRYYHPKKPEIINRFQQYHSSPSAPTKIFGLQTVFTTKREGFDFTILPVNEDLHVQLCRHDGSPLNNIFPAFATKEGLTIVTSYRASNFPTALVIEKKKICVNQTNFHLLVRHGDFPLCNIEIVYFDHDPQDQPPTKQSYFVVRSHQPKLKEGEYYPSNGQRRKP